MRDRLPVAALTTDAVVVAALVVGAGLAFGPAYGGTRYLVALGLGGGVLVFAVRRWRGRPRRGNGPGAA